MQSVFLKRAIIIGLVGIVVIVISFVFENSFTCSIRQVTLQIDMQNYDATKDPENCDSINNRIMDLDNQCKSDMTTLDCG